MALGDYFTLVNIGGIVAVVLAIWALWLLLRRPGGRLGEEKLEEKETKQLEKDELVVEVTQRDEKKQCRRIRTLIDELWTLGKGVNPDFVVGFTDITSLINLSLNRLESEKMNVEKAMETFRLLHNSINGFISHLPQNYDAINKLVAEINELQKKFYADLIKEINMHQKDKKILMDLWKKEMDQHPGQVAA